MGKRTDVVVPQRAFAVMVAQQAGKCTMTDEQLAHSSISSGWRRTRASQKTRYAALVWLRNIRLAIFRVFVGGFVAHQ